MARMTRNMYVSIAKELGYTPKTISAIRRAKTEDDISRIMTNARLRDELGMHEWKRARTM